MTVITVSVLKVSNVSIRYKTGDFKDIGILEYIQRRITGKYRVTEFWANRDISFTLEKGDMLGVIGVNGAGKTTLLKTLSGIMPPTEGEIWREGVMASLLELGSGFDGSLTVRENVYLRGAILGYSRQFINEMYDQIIDFAELRDFQDRPFRHLSSGMRSRLAFSIVSLVNPDILILDEVLSVSDGAFRKKSEAKMKSIIANGATTILVSHSIEQVRQMCNKVLWLHQGRQVAFGTDVEGICDRYVRFLDQIGWDWNGGISNQPGLVRQPPQLPADFPPFKEGLVSVVTPVFNGEGHLSRMLDSILGQTYDRIEMILVDDGSEDNTLAVAESYREKFTARGYGYRIVPAPHTCASGAINHGLPFVTGEYLIWPDSDDVLEPSSVEARVSFLRKQPVYHCVRSLSYYFDGKTGKAGTPDEKTGDLNKDDLFWDVLEIKTFVSCGCYMLRSEDFFAIYPQRKIPQYDVGQNFQMLLPFLYYYRCPTLQQRLYGVCLRENSHSRRKLTQAQEEKKYLDYESLVDDIAAVCRIQDQNSLARIARWKLNRRDQLSRKYHNTIHWPDHLRLTHQAEGSGRLTHQVRRTSRWKMLKDAAWYRLENTWVVTWLYPRYRAALVRCKKRFRKS